MAASLTTSLDVTEFARKVVFAFAYIRTFLVRDNLAIVTVRGAHSFEIQHVDIFEALGRITTTQNSNEAALGVDASHRLLLASFGCLCLDGVGHFHPRQIDSIEHSNVVETQFLAQVATAKDKDVAVDKECGMRRARSWDKDASRNGRFDRLPGVDRTESCRDRQHVKVIQVTINVETAKNKDLVEDQSGGVTATACGCFPVHLCFPPLPPSADRGNSGFKNIAVQTLC
mmetsp:Transcript_10562/g.15244  ORF Transcript_10562/g.15244 Transcript_10562/m.15244 type:complete len:229 (-) Transcript_10562:817-1503(-)